MFCNFHEMCYQFYERNNFKPFLTKQLLNMFKIWYEWGYNLIAKTDQSTSGASIFIMSLIACGTHALICKLQMEIKQEIKSYLSCSILESAAVRSEMKVVLRC